MKWKRRLIKINSFQHLDKVTDKACSGLVIDDDDHKAQSIDLLDSSFAALSELICAGRLYAFVWSWQEDK